MVNAIGKPAVLEAAANSIAIGIYRTPATTPTRQMLNTSSHQPCIAAKPSHRNKPAAKARVTYTEVAAADANASEASPISTHFREGWIQIPSSSNSPVRHMIRPAG